MTIRVVSFTAPAIVQDGGRRGHMHEGVPPGGALVPELLARANVAVKNPNGAAAIERFGALAIEATEACLVASEDGETRELTAGQRWELAAPRHRAGYLAIRGGLAIPAVLGGKGTLLVAHLGGHEGRALAKGDTLASDRLAAIDGSAPAFDLELPVRIIPGPDSALFEDGALDTLLREAFTIAPASDRVGTRLLGPTIARKGRDDARSMPMVAGAIQVPASGAPIVLGPDHPTTGGYAVIAVVIGKDLGRFAAHRIGASVRFGRL